MTYSPHTSRIAFALAAALAVAAAGIAALAMSSPAPAATSCGEKVLADWYNDGRIDRLYPLHCYEEAIDAIPPDIGPYVDARDVIERALQAAVNGKLAPGGVDPTPGGKKNRRGGIGPAGGGGGGPHGGSGQGAQTAPAVNTSSPSAVPIPLVVLGGMSLALLAAGGLGYVSRRRHAAQTGADEHGDDPPDDDPLA